MGKLFTRQDVVSVVNVSDSSKPEQTHDVQRFCFSQLGPTHRCTCGWEGTMSEIAQHTGEEIE